MHKDPHKNSTKTIDSVCEKAGAIIPSEDNDLATATRSIYVGTSGDIKVEMISGDIVTFKNAVSGSVLPIRVKKVFAADTTATDLVALL